MKFKMNYPWAVTISAVILPNILWYFDLSVAESYAITGVFILLIITEYLSKIEKTLSGKDEVSK